MKKSFLIYYRLKGPEHLWFPYYSRRYSYDVALRKLTELRLRSGFYLDFLICPSNRVPRFVEL